MVEKPINRSTKSVFVNDYLETEENGVFACGNFLHVHDLVDNVSLESQNAGKSASDFALGKLKKGKKYNLTYDANISYTIPNYVHAGAGVVNIKFRVRSKITRSNFVIKNSKDEIIAKKFTLACLPGEMQTIEFDRKLINSDIKLEVVPL